ncbi:MAG: homing endonuclease associated repeat-containing protein [Halolamina sp.]
MTTVEECLDALREAARELGKSPTKAEYEDLGLTPASATIIRNVGGWNDAKERAGLATNASTGPRVGPPPEGVSAEVRERWAELSVDQRWHYRNVEWNTERTLQRRAELQEWVDKQKMAEGCSECGESDPACLDYHHRDAAEKDKKVSQLVLDERSRERIREEIAKCDVLCANCHRSEHASSAEHSVEIELRRQPYQLVERESKGSKLTPPQRKRAWVRAYKARRGCHDCGHRKPAALDLHHIDSRTKTKPVSRFVSDGATIQQLLREVELCEVICANCHRKLHAAEGDTAPTTRGGNSG